MSRAFTTVAEAVSDDPVVVSLGDSYSSGEGLEPFYGQDKATADKVEDYDWLAHRSQSAWPGRLKFDRDTNPVSDYKDSENGNKWYFVASSGAKIENLSGAQTKTYNHKASGDGVYTFE